MTQKNSFHTILERISQLNKNSVEMIAKVSDIVSSNKNSVNINYRELDGSVSNFELPTVGWLKSQIEIANSNIRKLSGLDENETVIIFDENSSKKIKSIDLNREPNRITNLNIATEFKQTTNWFFENLINPTLSVELDLKGQIHNNVTKVLSKRYIIKFERDDDGTLSTEGQKSLETFENQFLNKNSFTITEFNNWLNLQSNIGLLNKNSETVVDEQYFDLNYKEINYKGYFSVLSTEKDSINNKLWYHLNTLTYQDRNNNTLNLSNGDILTLNNKKSFSKYKIIEIDTSSSKIKVSFERLEGYEPIPVGNSVLEYYSTIESQTKVNVSIGFDEYNVMFLKAINTDNNIISSDWSRGMSFYTNDLILDTDNNISMSDFYLNTVYDYGLVLKDLVSKKIPDQYGEKPNSTNLVSDNFKVVQINKHLTDTKDFNTLKKLHSEKTSIKSKLNEINEAITQKNVELNRKKYNSVAEKSKSQNELNTLIESQQSATKLYHSYINQISNSKVDSKAVPKFRIRGFWDIPDAIINEKSIPQEVIGFEIQYKYSSKYSAQNTTQGYQLINDETNKEKTGYFSDWNILYTDIRKRVYDNVSGKWIWQIEDISDADTPNINQLDISIQRSEKVQIRIRSISEVGYPDTKLYSDWSDIIVKEFPEELNEILGENDFILKEATQEEVRVSFENELTSKGIHKHVQESFYTNEEYFSHSDRTIATSFKDTFGNTLSLFDYLKQLNDKINVLEETIKRAKGELKVTLFKGTQETEITNGSVITVTVDCEDYVIQNNSTHAIKNFVNNVYLINDYYLDVENVATESELALLTNYIVADINGDNTENVASFINENGDLIKQSDNQYTWLSEKATIDGIDTNLYHGTTTTPQNTIVSFEANSFTYALQEPYKNISSKLDGILLDNAIWKFEALGEVTNDNCNEFGATIHPNINGDNNHNVLVDKSNTSLHIINPQYSEKIPIQIYFKPDIKVDTGVDIDISVFDKPIILNKMIKIRLDLEHMTRPFEFAIKFKLIRHRTFSLPKSNLNIPKVSINYDISDISPF